MASAMESDSGGGSGGADAQPPLAEVDGGLARVTRQLLLSGDDPAARLRALMPLELGIFGLGDLAQPVLVGRRGWQWRGELQLVWVAAASLWGLSDTRQLLQQRRGHWNAPFPIQAE